MENNHPTNTREDGDGGGDPDQGDISEELILEELDNLLSSINKEDDDESNLLASDEDNILLKDNVDASDPGDNREQHIELEEAHHLSNEDDDVPAAEENNPSLEDSANLVSDDWKPMTNQNVPVGFSEEVPGEDDHVENETGELNIDDDADSETNIPDKVNLNNDTNNDTGGVTVNMDDVSENKTDNPDKLNTDYNAEHERDIKADKVNMNNDADIDTGGVPVKMDDVSKIETDDLGKVNINDTKSEIGNVGKVDVDEDAEMDFDYADNTNLDELNMDDFDVLDEISSEEDEYEESKESPVKEENAVPVCVIVNNVPKDTSVEILKSYFPTASKIQTPQLNQSSNRSYGDVVIEFPSISEATNVYMKNYRNPAKIGEGNVTLAVIGLEIDPGTLSVSKLDKTTERSKGDRPSSTNTDHGSTRDESRPWSSNNQDQKDDRRTPYTKKEKDHKGSDRVCDIKKEEYDGMEEISDTELSDDDGIENISDTEQEDIREGMEKISDTEQKDEGIQKISDAGKENEGIQKISDTEQEDIHEGMEKISDTEQEDIHEGMEKISDTEQEDERIQKISDAGKENEGIQKISDTEQEDIHEGMEKISDTEQEDIHEGIEKISDTEQEDIHEGMEKISDTEIEDEGIQKISDTEKENEGIQKISDTEQEGMEKISDTEQEDEGIHKISDTEQEDIHEGMEKVSDTEEEDEGIQKISDAEQEEDHEEMKNVSDTGKGDKGIPKISYTEQECTNEGTEKISDTEQAQDHGGMENISETEQEDIHKGMENISDTEQEDIHEGMENISDTEQEDIHEGTRMISDTEQEDIHQGMENISDTEQEQDHEGMENISDTEKEDEGIPKISYTDQEDTHEGMENISDTEQEDEGIQKISDTDQEDIHEGIKNISDTEQEQDHEGMENISDTEKEDEGIPKISYTDQEDNHQGMENISDTEQEQDHEGIENISDTEKEDDHMREIADDTLSENKDHESTARGSLLLGEDVSSDGLHSDIISDDELPDENQLSRNNLPIPLVDTDKSHNPGGSKFSEVNRNQASRQKQLPSLIEGNRSSKSYMYKPSISQQRNRTEASSYSVDRKRPFRDERSNRPRSPDRKRSIMSGSCSRHISPDRNISVKSGSRSRHISPDRKKSGSCSRHISQDRQRSLRADSKHISPDRDRTFSRYTSPPVRKRSIRSNTYQRSISPSDRNRFLRSFRPESHSRSRSPPNRNRYSRADSRSRSRSPDYRNRSLRPDSHSRSRSPPNRNRYSRADSRSRSRSPDYRNRSFRHDSHSRSRSPPNRNRYSRADSRSRSRSPDYRNRSFRPDSHSRSRSSTDKNRSFRSGSRSRSRSPKDRNRPFTRYSGRGSRYKDRTFRGDSRSRSGSSTNSSIYSKSNSPHRKRHYKYQSRSLSPVHRKRQCRSDSYDQFRSTDDRNENKLENIHPGNYLPFKSIPPQDLSSFPPQDLSSFPSQITNMELAGNWNKRDTNPQNLLNPWIQSNAPNILHPDMNIQNQPPVNFENPIPVNFENPIPVNFENPSPMNIQNQPTRNFQNQTPMNFGNPPPMNIHLTPPVNIQNPPPMNFENPPPVNLQNPLSMNLQNPPPMYIQNPAPMNFENPETTMNFQNQPPLNSQNPPQMNFQNPQQLNFQNPLPTMNFQNPPPLMNFQNHPPQTNFQNPPPPTTNFQNPPPPTNFQNPPPPTNFQNPPPPTNFQNPPPPMNFQNPSIQIGNPDVKLQNNARGFTMDVNIRPNPGSAALPLNKTAIKHTNQLTSVENMGHTGHRGAVVFKYTADDQDRDNQQQQKSGKCSLDQLEEGATVYFGNTGRTDEDNFNKIFKQSLLKMRVMNSLIRIQFEKDRDYQLMTFTDRKAADRVIGVFNLSFFNDRILHVCIYKHGMRREKYDEDILVRFENCGFITENGFRDLLKDKLKKVGLVTTLRRIMFSYSRNYQLVSFSSLFDAKSVVRELGHLWKLKIVDDIESGNTTPGKGLKKRDNQPIKGGDDGPILKGYDVFVGQMPLDVKQKEMYDFFTRLFQTRGLCERGEKPIQKIYFVPKRTYQFLSFHKKADALACVIKFQHVLFMEKILNIKAGKNIEADYLEILQTEKKNSHRENESAARTTHSGVEKCSIYVDNLPEATYEELETFFKEQFVKFHICSANENIILKIDFKENRKYGFVWFCNRADAFACVRKFQDIRFKGYKLKVQPGKSIEAEYRGIIQRETKLDTHTGTEKCPIYIGNLPEHTYEELGDFFAEQLVKFGICSANENIIHRIAFKTRRNFQFVWLNKLSYATECIQKLNGVLFKGIAIKIRMGTTDGETRSTLQSREEPGKAQQAYTVYIGGTPVKTTYAELEKFVTDQLVWFCGTNKKTIRNFDFLSGRKYQFIKFHNKGDALTCIDQLDGTDFNGHRLKLRPGKGCEGLITDHLKHTQQQKHTQLQKQTNSTQEQGQSYRVFLGGMPRASCEEIKAFFLRQFALRGLSSSTLPIRRIPFVKNRPHQILRFHKKSEALLFIKEFDGVVFNGSKIQVKEDDASKNEEKSKECGSHLEDVSDISEDDDEGPGEHEVLFKNVADCEHRDLCEFIKKEFKQRGLYKHKLIQKVKSFENRGVHIVVFCHAEDANIAVKQLNGSFFRKNRLEVMICKGFTEEEENSPDPDTSDCGFSVRINNVSSDATFEDFQIIFENALVRRGVCKSEDKKKIVKEYKFKEGESTHYIVFHNEEQGMAAIQSLNKTSLMGTYVTLERS